MEPSYSGCLKHETKDNTPFLKKSSKVFVDGSVNDGNREGLLIDIENGKVIEKITRAEKEYTVKKFERLIKALDENFQLLSNIPKAIKIGQIEMIVR